MRSSNFIEWTARELRGPHPQPVGVPRRFSVGTMLLFTAMYGVLFALLTSLGTPPVLFLVVTVFITGVGASQAVLFKGKRPRTASMITGLVMWMLITLALALWMASTRAARFDVVWATIMGMGCGVSLGPICGYLAGAIAAGVFLFVTCPDEEASSADPPVAAEVVEEDT